MFGRPAGNIGIAATDRKKAPRKKTREELASDVEKILEEYYSSFETEEAIEDMKDLKSPDFYPEMVRQIVSDGMLRKEKQRVKMTELVVQMATGKVVNEPDLVNGLVLVGSEMEDLMCDCPVGPSVFGSLLGTLCLKQALRLPDILPRLAESLTECGAAEKTIPGILDYVRDTKGESEMIHFYEKNKIRLQDYFTPRHREQENYLKVYTEKYHLKCLFPLLDVEQDLKDKIGSNPSSAELQKWIEQRLGEREWKSEEFTTILCYALVSFCCASSVGLGEKVEKKIIAEEAQRFQSYKPVLKRFLDKKQVLLLFQLQKYANHHNFPKGLLLRLFNLCYHLELVDEEVFFQWRDDTSTEEGKAKALFGVSSFMRWLEEEDEEEEEEEESPGGN